MVARLEATPAPRRLAKRSAMFSWIDPFSDSLTKIVAALIALLSAVGITTMFQVDTTTGLGTLTLGGIPTTVQGWASIGFHAFGQYWLQKGYYLAAIKSNYSTGDLTPLELQPTMRRRRDD